MSTANIRYSRQIGIPEIGATGQDRLTDSSVLVLGAGGLGVPAATYLAGAGVGRMIVNDFDNVEPSNLPRQVIYSAADSGQPKAVVAAAHLNNLNPDVHVTALTEKLNRETLAGFASDVDVVLDCTDNFASRWLSNEVCLATQTPLATGAAIRMEGQLSVFRHDQSAGPCYRCLYSEADENLNDCAGQGILGPVAGMIGCMLATEALKCLLNIESGLAGKLWVFDAKSGGTRTLAIPKLDDCPACGQAKGNE